MADPLWTVVAPPQARRLRERLAIADDEPIELAMIGWSKRVALTADLALLFPRDHLNVEPIRNEAAALRAVGTTNLAEIPRVIDWIEDEAISPYPILVVNRLAGQSLEDAAFVGFERALETVARLAARWHEVDATGFRVATTSGVVDAVLGHDPPAAAAVHIRDHLKVDGNFDDAIIYARTLRPVLLHADLHEAQLLVADGELSGVIDWQTARLGHPYLEFDFGEWGAAVWRQHRADFPRLRRRQWEVYAATRNIEIDHARVLDWMWTAHHLEAVLRDTSRPDISGTLDEVRAAFAEASAQL